MMASPRPRCLSKKLATANFRVVDSTFAVATRSALALEFLGRLYGPSVIGDGGRGAETFTLLGRTGSPRRRWEVNVGDQRWDDEPSLEAALNRLEREICKQIIASHPNLIAMHGATVLTDRGAAFLTGPSGAGKSTLSLAMAARGYQVGGDDVALLDPRDGTIRPVPRYFHLDARSVRLLRGVGLAMPERALKYGFLSPADLGVTDPPASPLRLLLFLGRKGVRGVPLRALSQAEMLVRLLSETPRGAHSPSHIMGALKPLVGAAACYQILGGQLAETAETVAKLLGET